MRIEVREIPNKAVLFGLNQNEAVDSHVMNSLKPLFKDWQNRGYPPVVFESGEGNMTDCI